MTTPSCSLSAVRTDDGVLFTYTPPDAQPRYVKIKGESHQMQPGSTWHTTKGGEYPDGLAVHYAGKTWHLSDLLACGVETTTTTQPETTTTTAAPATTTTPETTTPETTTSTTAGTTTTTSSPGSTTSTTGGHASSENVQLCVPDPNGPSGFARIDATGHHWQARTECVTETLTTQALTTQALQMPESRELAYTGVDWLVPAGTLALVAIALGAKIKRAAGRMR